MSNEEQPITCDLTVFSAETRAQIAANNTGVRRLKPTLRRLVVRGKRFEGVGGFFDFGKGDSIALLDVGTLALAGDLQLV